MDTRHVMTGLALAGGAAVAVARLVRSKSPEAGPISHAATVVSAPEEVRRTWSQPGRLPGLLGQVPPTDRTTAPAPEVPGHEGLRLRTVLAPAPADRGTEIRVHAEGPAARRMSGRLRAELRRLKAVLYFKNKKDGCVRAVLHP